MTTNALNSGLGLTPGQEYYIRIYAQSTSVSSGSWAYNICVTSPTPSRIEYSRSYINVSKGNTGGTVNPGDTLEMRATIVITSSGSAADSLSFMDTLFNGNGLRLVPGSIALRTNEGKVYKSFTDISTDTDAGWHQQNGFDTIIRINMGTVASRYIRGRLNNNSRPSVFGSTCIVMATYRVVVYAPFNSLINFKTGALTYRDVLTGGLFKVNFPSNNLIVYQSPGLCPNAVSATNALGAEFNGTFGTPTGTNFARNRGTTPYTTYAYRIFATGSGPGDYYYGITNNTSGRFTTTNTWPKPDGNQYRVFNQWDIGGDHTGAADPLIGNPACDTTQPVSAANPCGYMLVINSAYKTDTAFTYTVNNLCPNTYYEISAWFKNVCYKCGCDSTGTSSAGATYIPTSTGDSSGVYPNIAFDVNGTDYFTTGDIRYVGLTSPTASDGDNRWVKRGFVYLTGPSENSFTLTLRNNAPGGGGNDWALDDISVATCLPNMQYSPSLSPATCEGNPLTINDTVRSYFNNYGNFKWQRSTDDGVTWTDIAGTEGSVTPVYNGSAYEYITSYTIPVSESNISNNGDRYRVVVGTTIGNISNADCQVTDGVSIITLTVINCGPPLNTDLLSFNGRLVNNRAVLNWVTSREEEQVQFEVERSFDGRNFTKLGEKKGYFNKSDITNNYSYIDSSYTSGRVWYRIIIMNSTGKKKYSRTVHLGSEADDFIVNSVLNPFYNQLSFNVHIGKDAKIDVRLLNTSGSTVKQQGFTGHAGSNDLHLLNTSNLPAGVYILQIQYLDRTETRRVIKK
jgi:hypothetical protein